MEEGVKIGQCAISIGREYAAFADGLQLLPEYAELWDQAMSALLAELGRPGLYRYGSRWSLEPPRERNLQGLAGVKVEEVEDLTVQAVDFSRWDSWEQYLRQVSNNAKRNAKRASREKPELRVRSRSGLMTLLDTRPLLRLHLDMLRRKEIRVPYIRVLARFILRVVMMRNYTITAVATDTEQPLAVFSGIEFGGNTYYLTGGSEESNGGSAWFLMLEMVRRAYERSSGAGKFVMGTVRQFDIGWENLARSREQCRVTAFPSSIVTFSYRPGTENNKQELRQVSVPATPSLVMRQGG